HFISSLSLPRPPPSSPLFPYTTLFRSLRLAGHRREHQSRDAGIGIAVGHEQHFLDVVLGRHRAFDRERERHSVAVLGNLRQIERDRKSTRLNSSHLVISYAVFCLKKKK